MMNAVKSETVSQLNRSRKKVLLLDLYNSERQGDYGLVLGANPDLSYRVRVITYQ